MNTAPKLPQELLARNVRNALGPYNDDDLPLLELIVQLRNKLDLAPPSGEGMGLTVADAWFESPTEITIHAKASCGAKLPEEGTKIYTAPQSAPEDGEQSFIDEWESRFGFLATHNNPRSIESIDEVACLLITPPPASQERGVAPWPDFAGNPIHAGDRIKHPDGVSGTVVYLPMLGSGGDAWRVVYDGEVTLSRLNLQIGDKGQAVVASPPSSAAESIPDFWVREDSLAAMAEDYVCDAAEQAKPASMYGLVNADQAQAGELQGFPFGKAMEAAHKMKLEDTEFGSEEVDALHREWDRLPLRDTYAVSLFLDKTMALLRRLAGGLTVDDAAVRRFVDAVNPLVYDLPPPDIIRAALVAALENGRG